MDAGQLKRFMNFVSPEPNSGCWLWTGSTTVCGYPQISLNGTPVRAHRASFEFFKKTTIKNKIICHTCDVPSCVNPDHLFCGTHSDNSKDKVFKNRQSRGERRPLSKLKETDVLYVRNSKESCVTLGREFGVSRSVISKIRRGEGWRHVK